MKLVLIIFDADKEVDVLNILSDSGVEGFTLWGPVHGKGAHSNPRMGTQVWPGDNRALITAVTEETAQTLKQNLQTHETMKSGVKALELTAQAWL